MNQELAEPVVHWSASGSILPQDNGMCPTCELMWDFIRLEG